MDSKFPIMHLGIGMILILLGFTPIALKARSLVSYAISPFTYGSYKILQNTINEVVFWKDLRILSGENANLQLEISSLKEKNAQLEEIRRENEILKKELGIAIDQQVKDMVLAQIVGWQESESTLSKKMILNKGSLAGVSRDDSVVSLGGLVGQIVEIRDNTSVCQLASDPQFKAAVMSQKGRVQGTLSGDFGTKIRMEHILQSENIEKGELIITTGQDDKFPKGLLVGFVEEIYAAPSDVEKIAIVNPIVSFYKLEEVLIWKKRQ